MADNRHRSDSRKNENNRQIDQFVEAARELGCDEDPAHFEEKLKKVARHKAPPDATPEPEKPKTKKPGH